MYIDAEVVARKKEVVVSTGKVKVGLLPAGRPPPLLNVSIDQEKIFVCGMSKSHEPQKLRSLLSQLAGCTIQSFTYAGTRDKLLVQFVGVPGNIYGINY